MQLRGDGNDRIRDHTTECPSKQQYRCCRQSRGRIPPDFVRRDFCHYSPHPCNSPWPRTSYERGRLEELAGNGETPTRPPERGAFSLSGRRNRWQWRARQLTLGRLPRTNLEPVEKLCARPW